MREQHEQLPLCFFNDTTTTEIYTLSLHDALPISRASCVRAGRAWPRGASLQSRTDLARCASSSFPARAGYNGVRDRKSTRLNSSHANISYAVFCLKKKQPPPLRCSRARTLHPVFG